MDVRIDPSWKALLREEFEKPYFQKLTEFIKDEYSNSTIFPKGEYIFRAFDECPVDKVKVVIIGQDPYHTPNVANGLAFSVTPGTRIPPSLRNIFKELESDLNIKISSNGDLSKWANQGVLLLNATLTVRKSQAGSHQNKGWEEFTDSVIKKLSEAKTNLVFFLWGAYAQKKENFIDISKHLIIKSAHPSPFSADRGFFGSKPFSKTNEYLAKNNLKIIDWQL
jgi:uracil-DNA glycosylase